MTIKMMPRLSWAIGPMCYCLICWCLFSSGCTQNEIAHVEAGTQELTPDMKAALNQFLVNSGTGKPHVMLLYAAADVNDDGVDDIVLIYRPAEGVFPVPDHDGNALCVLLSSGNGYTASNALPAPMERQVIRFRNIDDKPPLEFVVSGSKGARAGLGVYRVEHGVLENLFGESMNDCC